MKRVMLLIDADNVSADVIVQAVEGVLREQGAIHVRRAYCNAETALKHAALFKSLSIRPIVNLASGKNSTDIALAIDAMDLVTSERPELVVIVSSDSDFAPLVIRLREKGCWVCGVGQEGKTGEEVSRVYDEFVELAHRKASAPAKRPAPATAAPAKAAAAKAAKGAARDKAPPPSLSPVQEPASVPERAQAPAPDSPMPAAAEALPVPAASSSADAEALSPPAAPKPGRALVTELPQAVLDILAALPELRDGEQMELRLAAERLRTHKLLAKNASSTRLFKKHPELFSLTPEKQPNKVQLRSAADA